MTRPRGSAWPRGEERPGTVQIGDESSRSVDLRGRYSNRLDELKGLLGGTKTRVQESNP